MSRRLHLSFAVAAMMVASCGGAAAPSPTTTPASPVATAAAPTATPVPTASPVAAVSPTPSGSDLAFVAFGDSWPEGAHCGGCKTFVALWADEIERKTGRTLAITDLNGSREPGLPPNTGETSASLLAALKSQRAVRDPAAAADVILIATGPNEMEQTLAALHAGTCGGSDGLECVRALDTTWAANFDAILTEIDTLRAGKPTVVRLVSAANPFVSVPEMSAGLPKDFASTTGARIFQSLTDAICDAAAKHHAVCVDARPVLNGPGLLETVDENASTSMQAIADALAATGLAELTP